MKSDYTTLMNIGPILQNPGRVLLHIVMVGLLSQVTDSTIANAVNVSMGNENRNGSVVNVVTVVNESVCVENAVYESVSVGEHGHEHGEWERRVRGLRGEREQHGCGPCDEQGKRARDRRGQCGYEQVYVEEIFSKIGLGLAIPQPESCATPKSMWRKWA